MGVSVAINPVSLSTPSATSALGPSTSSRRADPTKSCRSRRKATPPAPINRSSSIMLMQNKLVGRSALGPRMSAVDLEPSLALKKKATDLSVGLKGTSIFLVGMNNTLKSGLGKALAEAMRYYYFDSDELVVQASGGSANARAFLETDEAGFRESETEVLKQLSSMGRLVVCCGDGAVRGSINLSLLRHGISVWIDSPLELLADEVINSKTEYPLSQAIPSSSSFDEVLDGIAEHFRINKDGYATADATVSLLKVASQLGYSDFRSVVPEDMAVEVLNQIEKLTRIKKMMEEAAKPF